MECAIQEAVIRRTSTIRNSVAYQDAAEVSRFKGQRLLRILDERHQDWREAEMREDRVMKTVPDSCPGLRDTRPARVRYTKVRGLAHEGQRSGSASSGSGT